MSWLELEPIATVRRNHGIEHATVHVLTARDPGIRLIGRADTRGFNIYGDVPTEVLLTAAQAALARLQAGEHALAVHPRCGTNLLVTGVLSALAAVIALGRKPKLEKLPDVIVATTFAAFIAQPLGGLFQARVTTSPDAHGARIAGIQSSRWGQMPVQHVDIVWDAKP